MWGLWQVPGDGRELVATIPEAVKIRAEDGRRVEATDISPFISNLPFSAPRRLGLQPPCMRQGTPQCLAQLASTGRGTSLSLRRCREFARRP